MEAIRFNHGARSQDELVDVNTHATLAARKTQTYCWMASQSVGGLLSRPMLESYDGTWWGGVGLMQKGACGARVKLKTCKCENMAAGGGQLRFRGLGAT